jgi:hypothetical protein
MMREDIWECMQVSHVMLGQWPNFIIILPSTPLLSLSAMAPLAHNKWALMRVGL